MSKSRYYLVGDEDGGVSLLCRDHSDGGGGPALAYAVFADLHIFDLARDVHEGAEHGEPVRMTEEVGRADG